jgi:hypothetical protein
MTFLFSGQATNHSLQLLGKLCRAGILSTQPLRYCGSLSTFYAFTHMQHLSTTTHNSLSLARRGALLLALGAVGPAAWGQSFGPVTHYSTGSGSRTNSVALADMNSDGRLDIIAACPNVINGTVAVLLGQVGGGFAPATAYSTGTGSQPLSVAVGDVNADGRQDIMTANYGTSTVGVLLGQANGFAAVSTYVIGGISMPQSVAVRDINNDGRLDIITANANSTVGVLLGQQSGFAPVTTYATGSGSGPQAVAVSDLNGDGRQDLVTANWGSGTAGVLLGQAASGFAAPNAYSSGNSSQPYAVALSDVSGDGRPDIITANYFTNDVAVLVQQSSGFAPFSSYAAGSGSHPQGIAVADVSGDGRADILTANYGTGAVGIMLGQAGGGFASPSTYSIGAGSSPSGIALGDVNGDGRADIVTANVGSSTVSVLLNTGTYTPLATVRPTAADITLAPNPAHHAFTVQLPAGLAPSNAELLNALGQVVRRPAVGSGSFRVETSGLALGLYTLRLLASGTALAKRVVVE